jgi:hypothetical protein
MASLQASRQAETGVICYYLLDETSVNCFEFFLCIKHAFVKVQKTPFLCSNDTKMSDGRKVCTTIHCHAAAKHAQSVSVSKCFVSRPKKQTCDFVPNKWCSKHVCTDTQHECTSH